MRVKKTQHFSCHEIKIIEKTIIFIENQQVRASVKITRFYQMSFGKYALFLFSDPSVRRFQHFYKKKIFTYSYKTSCTVCTDGHLYSYREYCTRWFYSSVDNLQSSRRAYIIEYFNMRKVQETTRCRVDDCCRRSRRRLPHVRANE